MKVQNEDTTIFPQVESITTSINVISLALNWSSISTKSSGKYIFLLEFISGHSPAKCVKKKVYYLDKDQLHFNFAFLTIDNVFDYTSDYTEISSCTASCVCLELFWKDGERTVFGFTLRIPWPNTYKLRTTTYTAMFKYFNRFLCTFILLPDAPMTDWVSQLTGTDYLLAPRIYTHEVPKSSMDNLFQYVPRMDFETIGLGSKNIRCSLDTQVQANFLLHIHYIRKMLCLGVFFLPGSSMYQCPAPRKRFCIDVQNPSVNFFKSKKVRKQLNNFRISVNRVFPEAMQLASVVHTRRSQSSWICSEVIETLWWFLCNETPGLSRHKQWSMAHTTNLIQTPLSNKDREVPGLELSNQYYEKDNTTLPSHSKSSKLSWLSNDVFIWKYLTDGTPDADVNILQKESVGFFPPIRVYSFELWDKKTNTLAAATFCYIIGRIACDYTHLTVQSDNRSCGKLLTLVVADIFRQAGISLWYWGIGLDYMLSYKDGYGGIELSAQDFYKVWNTDALGCNRCNSSFEFGKHRRPINFTSTNLSNEFEYNTPALHLPELFLCAKCRERVKTVNCLQDECCPLMDFEVFIDSGLAAMEPLTEPPCIPLPFKCGIIANS